MVLYGPGISYIDQMYVALDGLKYQYTLGKIVELDLDVERYPKIVGRFDANMSGSWQFSVSIHQSWDFMMFCGSTSLRKLDGKILYGLIRPVEGNLQGFMHTNLDMVHEDDRICLFLERADKTCGCADKNE